MTAREDAASETAVQEALRKRTERKPSIFTAPGNGAGLEAHGRIEGRRKWTLPTEPPTELYEYRADADRDPRPRLDASSTARFYDWLRENLGKEDVMPGLFQRSGQLVRVPRIDEKGWIPPSDSRSSDGPAQVRGVNATLLLGIIQDKFWVYREKAEEVNDPSVPSGRRIIIKRNQIIGGQDVTRLAVETCAEWENLPVVEGVSHTQTLRADGSLIDKPGYDKESKVLYLPDTDAQPPEWPPSGRVTEQWVAWSRDHINYLIRDFPFEQDRHRLNYIALLLTPLLRRIIAPPYPMFIINAHQRGTGKSLLAKVARALHGGVHRPELPVDDDEIRKQITSILTTTTAPVVNFDNITQKISSGQIANLLTTGTWSDRPLGKTATVEAANDRVWICTGNNVALGGDLARRVQRIHLDAETEHPEYRTGFAQRDLVGYATDNRGLLLQALLTQCLWWVQRGMPRKEIRTDDYDEWSGAIAEILEGGGLDPDGDFARGELVPEGITASDTEMELAQLLEMLDDVFPGGKEFQVKTLRRLYETSGPAAAERIHDDLPIHCTSSRDWWKSLGGYLRGKEKTVAGGRRVIHVRDARGGRVYVVGPVSSGLPVAGVEGGGNEAREAAEAVLSGAASGKA